MNRQTLLVTLGTIVLLIVGGVLLYATPAPDGTRVDGPGGAKAEKADKAKGVPQPRKLGEQKLVHDRGLPADRVAAPAGAPHVVLVIPSTQRRDQWTPYGAPPIVTPFLQKRAAEGVLMMDALSIAADPRPSDAAILTGLFPHRAGVVETSEKKNNKPIRDEVQTVAEHFAAAGWNTIGLSANHNLNDKAGGAQGFDWYRDSQPFSLMSDQRIDAAVLVQKALERVTARTEAEKAHPLFLQLALVDSHKPFKIPPAEFQPFQGGGAEVAPYQATLKRVDDALERLVTGLAAEGIDTSNTIFVVIADHGEGLDMPAHHRRQHGFVLYRSVVQIPWLWWGKGIPQGKRVDGLASQIDLVPTLLAVAGLAVPTGLDGVDVSAAVLHGQPTGRETAYADTLYEGVHRASIWTRTRSCQKDYGSKALEDDLFVSGCFDRVSDPDFTKTIEDPALAASLEAQHTELLGLIVE